MRNLIKSVRSYVNVGKLAKFELEYNNNYRHEEVSLFREEDFQLSPQIANATYVRALTIDPAYSTASTADYTGMVVCGLTKQGNIGILDAVGYKGIDDIRKSSIFWQLYRKWGLDGQPLLVGVEGVAAQRELKTRIESEMPDQGLFFPIHEVGGSLSREPKDKRIEDALKPRFRAKKMFFRTEFPLLKQQLLDFEPGSKNKKDLPDALAMCVSLLHKHRGQVKSLITHESRKMKPLQIGPDPF